MATDRARPGPLRGPGRQEEASAASEEGVSAGLPIPSGGSRVHVRRVLESWHRDDLIETAVLIVSELVSNAIKAHAACPEIVKTLPYADPDQIWMDLYRMGETVVLRVWDASPLTPVVRDSAPDDEHGRGLHLVDLLATDWGYYRPTPGGKIVWCTLASPSEEQAG